MEDYNNYLLDNMEDIMEMMGVKEVKEEIKIDSDSDYEEEEYEYLPSYDQLKNSNFNKKNGYKRLRYYNKLLNDLAGINVKKVDELLLFQINDLGVKSVEDIRKHLKFLGYSDNYDCVIKIASVLGLGKPFNGEIINRLRKDFCRVKEYFERDPSLFFDRHSFINYRFFTIKMLEYYGEITLSKLIVPLKNNVEFHEKCWGNIVERILSS